MIDKNMYALLSAHQTSIEGLVSLIEQSSDLSLKNAVRGLEDRLKAETEHVYQEFVKSALIGEGPLVKLKQRLGLQVKAENLFELIPVRYQYSQKLLEQDIKTRFHMFDYPINQTYSFPKDATQIETNFYRGEMTALSSIMGQQTDTIYSAALDINVSGHTTKLFFTFSPETREVTDTFCLSFVKNEMQWIKHTHYQILSQTAVAKEFRVLKQRLGNNKTA